MGVRGGRAVGLGHGTAEIFLPFGGRTFSQAIVQEGQLLHPEMIARFLRRPAEDDPAAVDHEQPVRQMHVLQHVRGADHRATAVGQVAEQFHQFELRGRVQPTGGFVQEEHCRPAQQFHADAHAFALAAR